jgi:hypothetical protein
MSEENLPQKIHQQMLLYHRHSPELSSFQRKAWLTVEYGWFFVDQLPAAYVKIK